MKTRAKARVHSRSGCANCKQRHIKCDEAMPACLACTKRNVQCPGYRQPVKWSDKYEKRAANDAITQPGLEGFWLTFEQEAAKLQAAIASNKSPSPQSITVSTPSDDYPFVASPGNTASPGEAYHTGTIGVSFGIGSPNNVLERVESPSHRLSSLFCADNGVDSLIHPVCSDVQEIEAQDGREQRIGDAHIHQSLLQANDPNPLSSHYFSLVCGITSGFDSPDNPFRALVAKLMFSYPQVFHSVNAMSAAHLYQRDKKGTSVSLIHRTEAISSLASGIQKLTQQKLAEEGSKALSAAILLATFLLGLTSTWNHASSFEPTYVQGARSVLQQWTSGTAGLQPLPPPSINSLPFVSQHTNFFVGIVAYLEAITAFHMDQEMSATDYLLPLCDGVESRGGQPNPLAGITPTLFTYMAKTGCIVRKHYLTRSASTDYQQSPSSVLLKSARQVQQMVLNYRIPPSKRFSETHDNLTPLSHFETIGRVYQLSLLLELYRAFPELMEPETPSTASNPSTHDIESTSYVEPTISQRLLSLAINILALLSQLPDTSRTKSIQLLPFVIAGSTLQYCKERNVQSHLSEGLNKHQGMTSLLTSDAVVSHWRSFVTGKLTALYNYIGLNAVQRGIQIIERVWECADDVKTREEGSYGYEDGKMENWVKIMYEEKLETLLG